MKIKWIVDIALLMLLTVPTVLAHTPFGLGNENNSITTAIQFDPPTKSWTLYRGLHEAGEVEYYKLHLQAGDLLQFSVSTIRSESPSFVPNAVVLWPGAQKSGDIPSYVEVPSGYGAFLIPGVRPSTPEYEPFTPTSYYFVVEYSQPVQQEGDYYFAVYEPDRGGKYNLAVGYVETFTLTEWLKIPFDVINIHIWEGQSLQLILAPILGALIVGLPLIFWRFKTRFSLGCLLGSTAGLLYTGSGLMTLTQMITASIGASGTSAIPLTLIFAIVPIALSVLILRKSLRAIGVWTLRDRIVMGLLAILGLAFWAGLIIGPVLIIALSILKLFDSKK